MDKSIQHQDPIERFLEIRARAAKTEPFDATAAALATADAQGRPSVRFVLVKDVNLSGFNFFTNLGSRKIQHIHENPRAALAFHWPSIEEQVRVEGEVQELSSEESDAYFKARPRMSQIGAWASEQSQELSDRATLDARVAEVEKRFSEMDVPRPPFWGGHRIVAERIEFWMNGAFRLHDRFEYRRQAGGLWTLRRLYP